MEIYTTSTFRETLVSLTKKSKDGYMSVVNDICGGLMSIYPKRGSQSAVDLTDAEYDRLLVEMANESRDHSLHLVDITNGLAELSQNRCLPGDKPL